MPSVGATVATGLVSFAGGGAVGAYVMYRMAKGAVMGALDKLSPWNYFKKDKLTLWGALDVLKSAAVAASAASTTTPTTVEKSAGGGSDGAAKKKPGKVSAPSAGYSAEAWKAILDQGILAGMAGQQTDGEQYAVEYGDS